MKHIFLLAILIAFSAISRAQTSAINKLSDDPLTPYFCLYFDDSLTVQSTQSTELSLGTAFTHLPPHSKPFIEIVDKTTDDIWFLLQPYWYVLYNPKTQMVFKVYSKYGNKHVAEHMLSAIELMRKDKLFYLSKPKKQNK